jgi:hypothetical protein
MSREIIIGIDEKSCLMYGFNRILFENTLKKELINSNIELSFSNPPPIKDTPYGSPSGISNISFPNIDNHEEIHIRNIIDEVFKNLKKQYSEQ